MHFHSIIHLIHTANIPSATLVTHYFIVLFFFLNSTYKHNSVYGTWKVVTVKVEQAIIVTVHLKKVSRHTETVNKKHNHNLTK